MAQPFSKLADRPVATAAYIHARLPVLWYIDLMVSYLAFKFFQLPHGACKSVFLKLLLHVDCCCCCHGIHTLTLQHRYGEQESRWIAYETWIFNTTFTAEEATELSTQEKVILYLGGLDTFADVAMNGQKLLEANNFHRSVERLKHDMQHVPYKLLTVAVLKLHVKVFRSSQKLQLQLQLRKQHMLHCSHKANTAPLAALVNALP
jgi:hypothetical protein